ncbi:MAG: hypothetical protein JWO36_4412 [Myxococcales bacterium]|nr:hypothetical protein [Myxococcales bacterium]
MKYEALLADLSASRDGLLALWAANLHVRGDLDAKLRWFYCDSPTGPGQAFLLHDENGVAVGCAGIGVRTIVHRHRNMRAALFADLAVDRGHRSGYPALGLGRAVIGHASSTFDLVYGFPNGRALAVYRRGGCQELGVMQRYVRVLRMRGYLDRTSVPAAVAVPVAMFADFGLSAMAKLGAQRAPKQLDIQWMTDFDFRFDRLNLKARTKHALYGDRRSTFLRWRFVRNPSDRYRIAALVDRQTDVLRGYAVVNFVEGTAELADLFAADDADLDSLLRLLVPVLDQLGCSAVSFRFLGASHIPKLLARHGFRPRGVGRSVIVGAGTADIDPATLLDTESWYLTDLDEDV